MFCSCYLPFLAAGYGEESNEMVVSLEIYYLVDAYHTLKSKC